MYEKFTDRANKVMRLANKEAQRFKHEYIGTEHILLGLIKEDTGVAACVLKNLDVDLRKIRLEVEKLMQSGPAPATMGKLPQTPRAKRVIEYSIEAAQSLNHSYVGTEHILLGLFREREGAAAVVLMNLGLKLEEVRQEVLNILGCESIEQAMKTMPLNKIEAGLDLAENAETGDITLTDDPPEEPLTDVLDGVTGGMVEAMDYLINETESLHEASDDVVLKDHVSRVLHLTRVHAQAIDKTAENLKETIRVMRAESTKMRTESDAAIEGSLAKILECVVGHVDLMLDPLSTQDTLLTAGRATKHLCRQMIHLAHLSAHVDPQAQAMVAGLDAVDRAIPTSETPTDADKA